MTCLLDTHFLVWAVTGSRRLRRFPWLDGYRPWGVSPAALLEVQFLSEIGRLKVTNPAFTETLKRDPRFELDDISFATLVDRALSVGWTRDPFDRLLAAHSLVRRVPLCTLDQTVSEEHPLTVPELD